MLPYSYIVYFKLIETCSGKSFERRSTPLNNQTRLETVSAAQVYNVYFFLDLMI